MNFWNYVKSAAGVLGAFIGRFLGGCDGLIYALCVFVVVDYITGVMCAVSDKKLSSEIGFRGICRKMIIFALVGIANICDVYIIGEAAIIRTAVVFFYLSNEGISILENSVRLGLPVPQKLRDVLEQLRDSDNKKAGE